MQFKHPRSAIVSCGLALVLGFAAPSVALAATDDGSAGDDSLVTQAAEDLAVLSEEPSVTAPENQDGIEVSTGSEDATEAPETDGAVDETADGSNAVDEAPVQEQQAPEEPQVEQTAEPAMTTQSTEPTADSSGLTVLADPGDNKQEDSLKNVPEGYYMIGSALNYTTVLDVAGGSSSNGANVQVYTANGSNAQKWYVSYVGEGYYIIKHAGTEKVLDVRGGESANGTNVRQYESNNSEAQQWRFVDVGNGLYNIISRLAANLALDVQGSKSANGTNIQVYNITHNNTDAQKFRLVEVSQAKPSTKNLENGTYSVLAAKNNAYSIDVSGGSRSAGANVQLYRGNGSQAQRFYFAADGKGYYTITVIGSGKVLSQANASVLNGNNIQQAVNNGSDIQKWAIYQRDNGQLEIVNKATNLTLDIAGGKIANGTNIRGYQSNKSDARFTLKSTPALTAGIYEIASFKNLSSILNVKGSSKGSGASLELNKDTNLLSERFEVQTEGSAYRIRTASSGGYLTYDSSKGLIQSNQKTVNSNNKWNLVWNGTYFSLANAATGQVLDAKGGNSSSGTVIQTYKANGTDAQHYYFIAANLLENGTFIIKSGVGTVLDVKGGATTNGANVQAYTLTGAQSQQFTVKATGSTTNTYSIVNVKSGKAVEANASKNVQQNTNKGNNNQLWKAVIADGGGVSFLNAGSGLALDIKNGSASSGANVQTYTANGTKAQRWTLQKYGWYTENGKHNFYNASGKATTWNQSAYNSWTKIKSMTSKTKYLGALDQNLLYVTFFIREADCWVPCENWICSVNAHGRTPKGTYAIRSKAEYVLTHFGSGSWYWSHWGPDYQAFHSVLTAPGSKRVTYSGLGRRNTSGCVRCPMEKAYWVWKNVPIGTTVYSY